MALDAGVMAVTVEFAQDLKKAEWFGRQDPYCIVTLGGQQFRTRVATDGGKNPVWNETFRFEILNENELQLEVKDDQLGHDSLLGGAAISLARARQLGTDRVEAAVISPHHRTQHGVVSVSLQWEPNGAAMRAGGGYGGGYGVYAQPPMQPPAPPMQQQYGVGGGFGGMGGGYAGQQQQRGYAEEVVVVEQPAHHRHHHHGQQQQEVIEIVRPY